MKKTTKKKVLICGATGFIGRNIVNHFSKKENLDIYGTYYKSDPYQIPKIHMVSADLTNKKDVDRVIKGMDIVIQAAATTSGANDIIKKPYYHVTDNAVMNSLIFRAAHEHNISHLIFFSCTVMYQSSNKPLKESDFNASEGIYPKYFGVGWTKVYIEKMAEFYSRIGNTKYTVIRHSNIYGPYDKFDLKHSHVFGATITKIMEARDKGEIVVWGEGEEERDLLYVSDLVNFVEIAIDKQISKFELFNVGLSKSISVADLVRKIIKYSGKRLKIRYDKRKPTLKTKICLNTTKAKRLLGWSPRVSLNEGIKKTMNWYKLNYK